MASYRGQLTGRGKKIGIVVSRFNEFITHRLLQSAVETLEQAGVLRREIEVVWVPGSLEVPLFCQKLAKKKKLHALIALACVLRGDTFHFECVARELTRAVSQVALEERIPIATGMIAADRLEDAIDRAGLKSGNKGSQAALAALEIADLDRQLGRGPRKKQAEGKKHRKP